MFDKIISNVEDENEADRMQWATTGFCDMGVVINYLMSSSLTSRQRLNAGQQGPLPDNQWQLEVENWYNIGLASLQSIADYAVGPGDADVMKHFWASPNSQVEEMLCKNQVRAVISWHQACGSNGVT